MEDQLEVDRESRHSFFHVNFEKIPRLPAHSQTAQYRLDEFQHDDHMRSWTTHLVPNDEDVLLTLQFHYDGFQSNDHVSI